MSKRIPRVNQLIKKEFSQLLLKEIDLPQDLLITVTRVETVPNLSESKIYISIIPEAQKNKVFYILEKQIYHLQQKLNKRLKMRPMPKIRFLQEEKTNQAGRIEEVLEKLKERGK